MKTISILFVLSALGTIAPYSASAQEIVPSMEWEHLYKDSACSFSSGVQTSDGGYIFGGVIYDVAGQLDPVGAMLVKVDSQGEVQWEKVYGGGGIRSVWQTKEGNYVFAATTYSTSGHRDAWLVMVDAQGDKQWEKSFGGPDDDDAAALWQGVDGGFVIAGHSPGGFGAADGWVIRIDADGVKQWERSFGGENNDLFTSVRQSQDGGYLLAGVSYSSPSGNKESPNFGSGDAWLVKVDSEGNKQWEKSFGGTEDETFYSLDRAMDGGAILGGTSSSPPSGNKESHHFGRSDSWVVKVDASGDKQWERSYGTTEFSEVIRVVRQTSDGGFALGANGNYYAGLIKLDAQGNQQWDQSFGNRSNSNEFYTVEIVDLQQARDGGYVLIGSFDLPDAGFPASGCTWGAWTASLESVVSFSHQVVTWQTAQGVVLESVGDLDTDWGSHHLAGVLSIGDASAFPLIQPGQQRYYRLRASGAPNEIPNLSFGAVLNWPVSQDQKLEFSSTKADFWRDYPGDQGIIGDTHYAIIPQTLRTHFFRARTQDAETE